jgi:hypothetical protein
MSVEWKFSFRATFGKSKATSGPRVNGGSVRGHVWAKDGDTALLKAIAAAESIAFGTVVKSISVVRMMKSRPVAAPGSTESRPTEAGAAV